MDMHLLEKIGLKQKEVKIYISLLKEGPSLANAVAKNTNILRSSIYDYLDILLDKGFITYTIKSGKKYFQAVSPNKILDNFEEEKAKEEEALKSIVPELIKVQGLAEKKAFVEVFEGKEGMKSAMSGVLKDNPNEIMISGSSGASFKVIPFFMEHWHRERVKKKIRLRITYADTSESRERVKKGPTLKMAEIRFMPIKGLSVTGTILYNEKILLTIWDSETPFAVLIQSKEASKSYKDNFEVLWKNSSKK